VGESQPAAIPIKAQAIATLVEGQHVIAAWEQEQRLWSLPQALVEERFSAASGVPPKLSFSPSGWKSAGLARASGPLLNGALAPFGLPSFAESEL